MSKAVSVPQFSLAIMMPMAWPIICRVARASRRCRLVASASASAEAFESMTPAWSAKTRAMRSSDPWKASAVFP